MQTFPSTLSRFVSTAGIILQPFISYLQQFTIAPPAFSDITVGASPFEYEAKEPGNVFIDGGMVSAITLTRGTDTITVTGSLIPVGINDIVTITYSVLPAMKFIPSYGQNTTS